MYMSILLDDMSQRTSLTSSLVYFLAQLSTASSPAFQPAERCDVQTKRFRMHVLLQPATATETRALKTEFKMIS